VALVVAVVVFEVKVVSDVGVLGGSGLKMAKGV
jgi:hypothetical protein